LYYQNYGLEHQNSLSKVVVI